jgi:hypothetical protein
LSCLVLSCLVLSCLVSCSGLGLPWQIMLAGVGIMTGGTFGVNWFGQQALVRDSNYWSSEEGLNVRVLLCLRLALCFVFLLSCAVLPCLVFS